MNERQANPTAPPDAPSSAPSELGELERNWDQLATGDPLWAILSVPSKRGGGWDVGEFMATGEREIAEALAYVAQLPVHLARESALDFGCGVGRLTAALGRRFRIVHGVDISAAMIARARELNAPPNLHFHQVSEPRLPFDDEAFDLVYSRFVLQHMETKFALAYISEFTRVLRPGGLALFQTTTRDLTADQRGSASPVELGGTTAVIEMHAHPTERIEAVVAASGARIVDAPSDPCAGEGFESVRFAVIR